MKNRPFIVCLTLGTEVIFQEPYHETDLWQHLYLPLYLIKGNAQGVLIQKAIWRLNKLKLSSIVDLNELRDFTRVYQYWSQYFPFGVINDL